MTKTDYLGIHENQYKYFRKIGREAWNDSKSIKLVSDLVLDTIQKHNLSKSINILELGCGDGELSLSLAKLGYIVSGIDISPTAIEWAKKKALERDLKANFNVGDVLNMDIEDNSYDIVVDSYCLHCIIGKDRSTFLKEIKRILKPEGLVVGITMSNTIPDDIKPFFNDKREMVKNGVVGRYIGLSDNILNEFKEEDFEIVDHSVEKDEGGADDLKYVCRIN
ncbi:MAG: class I SAM-dependent methyltransferase [Candidatus Delongbacteria bacterium]|jgi:ubiquinone/menaquinone biosynthesis C-methylase UbiE|nr:class I SAM-dependent methyltransferase [Candidatus Delongbacteria bacterium]